MDATITQRHPEWPADSIGLVQAQTCHIDQPLNLRSGKTLPAYDLVYETYGELNADRSNAILICHALSGDHHAAGYHALDDRRPGWWNTAIGPGKPIDTDRFHVVCLNNLGGCRGSTGPASINPETDQPFGPDFPIVTVVDWVNSQYAFMQHLNIPQWAAVIGGSLGGMQAMQWSVAYPKQLRHAIIIASAPKLSAQNIAFNEVAREAIRSDANFHGGYYLQRGTAPNQGLMLARMLGHITYQSDDVMGDKFGRDLRDGKLNYGFNTEFEVESYLHHQGNAFVDRFDANTYLLMTKALDYFDPAYDHDGNLTQALAPVQCDNLLISFTSDWRFSPARSREIVRALLNNNKHVSYAEIEADQGHDAFLLRNPRYLDTLSAYLQRIAGEVA